MGLGECGARLWGGGNGVWGLIRGGSWAALGADIEASI